MDSRAPKSFVPRSCRPGAGAGAAGLVLLLAGCATTPGASPGAPATGLRPRPSAPAGLVAGPSSTAPVGTLATAAVELRAVPPSDRSQRAPEKRHLPRRPESPIPEWLADNLRAAALDLPPSDAVQRLAGGEKLAPLVPTLTTDFDGPHGGENSPSAAVPADAELAVGPAHLVAIVNSLFSIYDKEGTRLAGPVQLDSFFSTLGCTGTFDPNALYDEESDRFFVGIDANDGTRYCFAGSQTSDPTGGWWTYALVTAVAPDFFDYPHAGVGDEVIVVGANVFPPGEGAELRPEVWAFDKAALFAGTLADVGVVHRVLTGGDTPQPANLHGFAQGVWPATDSHLILADKLFDGTSLTLWSWQDPYGADALVPLGDLDLDTASGVAAGFPIDVPQGGGGKLVQANDWRIQDAELRNGRLWTAQTIACNPGGGAVDCLRWAEIDPTGPSVVQAGVFGSDGEFRTFGDLAVDGCGGLLIGYTKSSSATFPGVFVTGRLAADPPGTVQPETLVKAGEVAYTAFDPAPRRWGDYTGATSDPDGAALWYLGEYSKAVVSSAPWGTRVAAFDLGCAFFADGFESGTTGAWSSTVP